MHETRANAVTISSPRIGRTMTGTAPRSAVLRIVDPDVHGRNAMQTALERRFGQNYEILTVASAEAARYFRVRFA